MTDALARQIADTLGDSIWRLSTLLGGDVADLLLPRAEARAQLMAAELRSGDDRLAAQTVIDLTALIWPDSDPPAEWWRTPLGRAAAASVGREDTDAASYSVAAAILGVSKTRVQQLVATGKLERHPDGGITRTSIYLRLATD